jgi:hypothetical protein
MDIYNMQTSRQGQKNDPKSPFINPASKCLANHVSKFSISHLAPSIAKDCKMLPPNNFTT